MSTDKYFIVLLLKFFRAMTKTISVFLAGLSEGSNEIQYSFVPSFIQQIGSKCQVLALLGAEDISVNKTKSSLHGAPILERAADEKKAHKKEKNKAGTEYDWGAIL